MSDRNQAKRNQKKIRGIVRAKTERELFSAIEKAGYFAGNTAEYWKRACYLFWYKDQSPKVLTRTFGLRDSAIRIKAQETRKKQKKRKLNKRELIQKRKEAIQILGKGKPFEFEEKNDFGTYSLRKDRGLYVSIWDPEMAIDENYGEEDYK